NVRNLDAARRCGGRAEVLVADEVGRPLDAGQHGDVLLDDVADEVAEHAPVHDAVDADIDLDAVRAEPAFGDVQAEVRDLARQHGRARALPALGVRAFAEHRVAVADGGRLHPRAVLAALRHVADEIRRAGLQDLDAVVGGVALAFAAAPRGFR